MGMSLLLTYVVVFVTGVAVSLILTPIVRSLARRVGAMDLPNYRKVHTKPIPSLGGIAIIAAFATSVLIGLQMHPGPNIALAHKLTGVFIGCLVLMSVGIYDDIKGVRPIAKLLGQIIAAIVLILYGFDIEKFTSPLSQTGSIAVPATVGVMLTVLWVVGLTNAVN
nr:undecaprenyl/decaprenyl-phosphate alpha-N-acetylglucosaminyl 1-phosphate transferase [Bacillota bacterium]